MKIINKEGGLEICDAGTPDWVVTDVSVIDNYTLLVTFITGEKKSYAMKPHLDRKIFAPLIDVKLFRRAHVEGGTVVWNDKIDIAPEELYKNGILVK